MSNSESIILGIIQGVGEFLPISSSGHLIIVPYLFNLKPHSLSFDVALHLGTLCAVGIYFFSDWVNLIKEGFLSLKERTLAGAPERRLFWFILIATIPGALAGKFFEDKAETVFRNPLLVAFALGGFALILYLAQKINKGRKSLADIKLRDAFLIGLAQSVAIFPGISRSGATIASGLFLNLKKEEAVRFSFLLSFPLILGAGILKLESIIREGQNHAFYFWAGFSAAALFGLLSIHFLLRFIRKYSFNLFICYRVVVSLLVIILFILRKG